MKNTIITVLVLALIGFGIFYFTRDSSAPSPVENEQVTETPVEQPAPTPEQIAEQHKNDPEIVIGSSAGGNEIKAYRFGTGAKEILFVAGIHGGYSWNTVLLAQELMTHLKQNPTLVPAGVKVTVVPVMNPDGLKKVVGTTGEFTKDDVPTGANATVAGRFNSNNVDLNRNFDCDWQGSGVWQNKSVSGGTSAFSEPESQAIRNYVMANHPAAVISFDSAAGGVFASNCHAGVPAETNTILEKYADASGYKAYADFDFYEVTGDMVNWLAKENVPAISVLLTNHSNTEWSKNLAGIKALLTHYSN